MTSYTVGGKDDPPAEHRCSQCYTPGFGKSSIRCRNEPADTQTKGTP